LKIHHGRKKCYGNADGNGNDVKSDKTSSSQVQVIHHSNETNCEPNAESDNTSPEVQRICWPKMNDEINWKSFDEDAAMILRSVGGSLSERVVALKNVINTLAVDRFGKMCGKKKPVPSGVLERSRRQVKIGQLKVEKNNTRAQWKRCVDEQEKIILKGKFEEIKKKHQGLLRAERSAKVRKAKKSERKVFMKDPFKFTKKLFTPKTSGKLTVSKEALDAYLDSTYGDERRDEELPYMPGLVRPTRPGVKFELGPLKYQELEAFLKKARASSAPGPNGIPYRVYKKCPELRSLLFGILKTAWNQQCGPKEWSVADGIFIPKVVEAAEIGDFRVTAKTNVEGKIFFGLIAKRLTNFLLANGYIDTTVQKAGIPGFSGCMEHSAMVWDLIQQSRKEEEDLAVVWLDLANAYGSVPHAAIMYALDFFWVPEHVIQTIKAYLDVYKISFVTPAYRSKDVSVEKGVAAGDTISPLLFVMVKEIVIKGSSRTAGIVRCPRVNEQLPPIRAFMDDLTCTQQRYEEMVKLLRRLEELIGWVRMQFKPRKCRALVLRKGKIVSDSFEIGDGVGVMLMPSVLEKPVKCLGRLYTAALSDSERKVEVRKDIEDGLRVISDCKLQGTLKCWMYQFGLLPRIMWPMIMYEIPMTAVEEFERLISKHLRRWLCLPPGTSSVALYATSTNLSYP